MIPGNRTGVWPGRFCLLLGAAIVLSVSSLANVAWGIEDFSTYRAKTMAPVQPGFDRIVTANPNDPELKRFRDRIALIDEVARLIVGRFQSARAASLDALLDEAGAGRKPSNNAPAADQTLSAAEILSEYRSRFDESLPKPNLPPEQLTQLSQYYNTLIGTAENYVAERGRVVAAMGKKGASEVPRLCVVLTFLHVPDESFSAEHVHGMAKWLQDPPVLQTLEEFSLSVERPLTAYRFALARTVIISSATTQPATRQAVGAAAPPTVESYLLKAADGLVAQRNYRAAVLAIKAAIGATEKQSQPASAAMLRVRLAEVLSNVGHPQMAADEMKTLLSTPSPSPDRGRWAMLRLKYLYESTQFDDVVAEAKGYETDPQCAPYLPQVLYLDWVTQRRLNKPQDAQRLQTAFLEKFPAHPLGADMHFASAMTALAAADYAAASRDLELIQYRYPDSKLLPKVKEIQDKLKKVPGPPAAGK